MDGNTTTARPNIDISQYPYLSALINDYIHSVQCDCIECTSKKIQPMKKKRRILSWETTMN